MQIHQFYILLTVWNTSGTGSVAILSVQEELKYVLCAASGAFIYCVNRPRHFVPDLFPVRCRSVVTALENMYVQRSLLMSSPTRTPEISVKCEFVELGLIPKKIFLKSTPPLDIRADKNKYVVFLC